MSKHPSDNTKRNLLRRGLAGILTLALLLGLLPATIVPAHAHWADPYVETLVDWGVMRGDISGNMAPERTITRAEFVAMMNRAYGYTRTAGHPFTDVNIRNWYNDDIDIGYNMGYFKGTSATTASPNSPLTREQAAVLLARNMMLQPTVGETLGFSDSRTLSDWSRDLVGAATQNGILSGYSDGSFKPQNNITRGEVAAMLVRAIGTPIQEAGDHTLGNVYGNVTVNTSGVRLRDGVITGNLYLTGGIDLGDVLMENVTVLGEIIVSGAGESNSAQSSIVLRNVTANSMSVDSISDQFVTIRAEGNTDIKTTTVRTNAYVDDSSLPGYGLWKIIQDGGSLLQLAGNAKEVVNQTPNSEIQIVQGVADKVTIDEKATNSSVLVDGDARVDELDLDVATNVTGEGDIKDLNVGAAGSTVEQLPDNITIRPGITTDINGSEMNSSQAAQASTEPMLLAGYPRAKNVAPTSATLVFSVNKPGTIYWAVSAVADGSVDEDDLIENPTYGGKILQAGTINAAAANTEYTANVTGLAQDGSYYISAILVDGRDKRSPVKVTAFTTPDGTRPAFIGNPTATLRTTKTAQVTGTPNKSCQLFWALLPETAAAPTANEFKANAVRGNLGYGSMDVTKNVSQSINVNRGALREKTNYVAYLWLTDHDGAQSSQVYRVPIYIPDETPPVVNDVRPGTPTANSVEVSFTMNEPGRLHWAIVTDEMHDNETFLDYTEAVPATSTKHAYLNFASDEDLLTAKVKVMTGRGAGAIVSGSTNVTAANTITQILNSATRGLDPATYNTSNFVIYFVGEDSEGNLSQDVGYLEVHTLDETPPTFVRYRFNSFSESDNQRPLANTDVELIFSESIRNGASQDGTNRFLTLYQEVEKCLQAGMKETDRELQVARKNLSDALYNCLKFYSGSALATSDQPATGEVNEVSNEGLMIDYRYATVSRENGQMVISFPHTALDAKGDPIKDPETGEEIHAVSLESGGTYHFVANHIYDCATPGNAMPETVLPDFQTLYAQVDINEGAARPQWMAMAKTSTTAAGSIFTSTRDGSGTAPANSLPFYNPNGTASHYTTLGANATSHMTQYGDVNDPARIDKIFTITQANTGVDPSLCYDILIWSDVSLDFTLYSRPLTRDVSTSDGGTRTETTPWSTANTQSWDENGAPVSDAAWEMEGSGTIYGAYQDASGDHYSFTSMNSDIHGRNAQAPLLKDMENREYVIHIDRVYDMVNNEYQYAAWNTTINFQISVVAGREASLNALTSTPSGGDYEAHFQNLVSNGSITPINTPQRYPLLPFIKRDTEPPRILTAQLENSATRPLIRVTMSTPGTVHCIAVPLTVTLKDGVTGSDRNYWIGDYIGNNDNVASFVNGRETVTLYNSNASLNDKEPEHITDLPTFPFPTGGAVLKELEQPAANKLTFPQNRFGSGVVKGTCTPVQAGSGAEITFDTPLQPNTVYFLCMATQGSDMQSLARHAVGFYFATQRANTPTLKLAVENNSDVRATVTKSDARVDSLLLVQGNLPWPFGEKFYAPDNSQGLTFTTITADQAGAGGIYARYARESYTVVQAMSETFPGSDRSVFDELASQALKDRVIDLITSLNQGGAVADIRKNQTINVSAGAGTPTGDQLFDFSKTANLGSGTYVCVGMATVAGTSGGEYSFSAAYPVQDRDPDGPKIQRVLVNLTPDENDADKVSGSVTIQFDKDLYRHHPLTGMNYPLAHTLTGDEDVGTGSIITVDNQIYVTLRGTYQALPANVEVYTQNPVGLTRNLTFTFKSVRVPTETTTWEFALPEGLRSFWDVLVGGTSTNNQSVNGSVSVTYTKSTNTSTFSIYPRSIDLTGR